MSSCLAPPTYCSQMAAHGEDGREILNLILVHKNGAAQRTKRGDFLKLKTVQLWGAGQTPYPPFDRCPPNRVKLTAANRSRCVRIRRSTTSPLSVRTQIWLPPCVRQCQDAPWLASTFAAHDRVHHCGASATTRGGGQPLHPIFRLTYPVRLLSVTQGQRHDGEP